MTATEHESLSGLFVKSIPAEMPVIFYSENDKKIPFKTLPIIFQHYPKNDSLM
jgi:hypothetical protein